MKKIAKNKDMLRLVTVMLGSILMLLFVAEISNHNNVAIISVILAVFVIGVMLYSSYRNGLRTIDCLKKIENHYLSQNEKRAIEAWRKGKKFRAIRLLEQHGMAITFVPTLFGLLVAVCICFL